MWHMRPTHSIINKNIFLQSTDLRTVEHARNRELSTRIGAYAQHNYQHESAWTWKLKILYEYGKCVALYTDKKAAKVNSTKKNSAGARKLVWGRTIINQFRQSLQLSPWTRRKQSKSTMLYRNILIALIIATVSALDSRCPIDFTPEKYTCNDVFGSKWGDCIPVTGGQPCNEGMFSAWACR